MARTAAPPPIKTGRAYRTQELARWSANPTRLAKRLVRQGFLHQVAHGLYARFQQSRFGLVPPTDEQLLRAFLKGSRFVVTGPERWNTLGLGATSMHAATLVYNTRRSGTFHLGGRPFVLRRVAFPRNPPKEWFAVDLLQHADQAGVSRGEVANALGSALAAGRLDPARLEVMAQRFATREVQGLVQTVVASNAA